MFYRADICPAGGVQHWIGERLDHWQEPGLHIAVEDTKALDHGFSLLKLVHVTSKYNTGRQVLGYTYLLVTPPTRLKD